MLPERGMRKLAVLAFAILLPVVFTQAQPAAAAVEDVAMFYDSLAPYGNWIDYGNYGPVWAPSKVSPNWRPYVDGRWVPTSEGWTFETSEPWGWATYHFGNWMPTTDYGWVWSPGSTWYPSTAAWRTSDSYVGWAPTPPPDYVPEPEFAPAGGYEPGTPALDLLTAPFWVFAQAASFLLGFGQPYAPGYSYYNCGCMAPFDYGPVVYGGTFPLTDFYYPGYASSGFYCFGPPFPFVSRVSNVNIVEFNNYVNTAHFGRFRNVLPPESVLNRHAYLRGAIPDPVREGRRFDIHRATDISRAERGLNQPRALKPPSNVPRLTKEIPKVAPAGTARAGRAGLGGVKGMGLPGQATRHETTQMRQQIRLEQRLKPQTARPGRMETLPEFRHVPPGEFRPGATPAARPAPSREVRPAPMHEARPAAPHEAAPAPLREVRPAAPHEAAPTPFHEARPAPSRARPAASEVRAAPSREFHAPAVARPAPQREFRGAIPQREFRAPAAPREFRQAPRPEFHAPAPRSAPVARPQVQSAPAPRSAPAPAPRSAPAPAPRSAPAPAGRPGEHH